ncbi:MAG: DUF1080 domain-containing protein [Planctomycetia bacterium]|nr:DUF1080 domain-containing protein [Planctomycetia bacterium]
MRLVAGLLGLALVSLTTLAIEAAEAPKGITNLPLIFSDDFESGKAENWAPTDPAAWKISKTETGNVYSQFAKSDTKTPVRSPFNRSMIKDVTVSDFVLDVKLQSTVKDYGHRDMCLFFGYQDAAHLYYVHLGKQTDDHANQIFIVNSADRKKISTKTSTGTNWTDSWHHVRLVRDVKSGSVKVFFDNMDEPVMEANDTTFSWGQVGVGSFDDMGNFDNVFLFGNRVESQLVAVADQQAQAVGKRAERPDNTPPEGFSALFNGKDLTGWHGLVKDIKQRKSMTAEQIAAEQVKADESAKAHWRAENGVLVFDGKGQSLCSAKDYADIELYCDWKIEPKGDSGIYVRGTPQIQIWDPSDEAQLKNGADKGSGSLWNNQKNPRFPDVKADNPIGQWNTFFIRMVGDKVTITLNGKTVVNNVTLENYWERDKPCYETGPIELQNHGNTLYFKNIYVRELPKK